MAAPTRLNVTLYAQCLVCWIKNIFQRNYSLSACYAKRCSITDGFLQTYNPA